MAIAVVAIALAAAMMLGGSGSLVPSPEIALQCVLAFFTVAWVWVQPSGLGTVPRSAWFIAAALLALPLLQLLPLPPIVWQNLPGRPIERAALNLVGQGESWRPLSLTPNRTLASLLAMVAAAAMLIMTAAQDRRGRAVLLATMAAMALFSVVIGAAQLSGGAGNGLRFYNPEEPFLDGFQTNHNAEADVLLIGMVALAAAAAEFAARRPPAPVAGRRRMALDPRLLLGLVGGATLLLTLGVVLTASRTGIALLPVALGGQALILRRFLHRWLRLSKPRLAAAAIVVGLAVLSVVATASNPQGALAHVWARFHVATEFRPEIWHDALFAMRQYWPWGAGMGSFIPVFAAAERLEVVTGKFVNRAHNDYLELLIEAGLPGIAVLGLIGTRLARDARHRWQARSAGCEAQLLAGGAALTILALHSLGDYPLRTLSIACMTAVSAGLLLPMTERGEPGIGKE